MLTERQQVIMTRWMTLKIRDMNKLDLQTAEANDDSEIYSARIHNKPFELEITIYKDIHEEHDDEIDSTIILRIDKRCVLSEHFGEKKITLEDWEMFLRNLQNRSTCSSCDNYFDNEEKDEFCHLCYPFAMKREDDCAICLTNKEAVWIETKCKHIFHQTCFREITSIFINDSHKIKCPLCRTNISHCEYEKI
jgi:hypothetical protein